MFISIETPVFKDTRLQRCIDSVLHQSSPHWKFSLLWDGGDEQSRRILEELDRKNHPNVVVHFAENRGIARARRFLSEHSEGDFILPLDDDDALPFHAVERFLAAAERMPWSAVIRARREIIDEEGRVLDTPPWFPFEPRHYQNGMVTDVFNHSQPYLIRRTAYDRTSGWEGFEDFGYAGEDCDIYLKLEEAGSIELLDEVLYYYRVHDARASLVLTDQAAFEMWRRLADKTVARIGLPLRRTNDKQPFEYERLPRPEPTLDMVDFIVVTDGGPPDRLAASLGRLGVPDDALQVVTREGSSHINAGLRRTTRPLVCLVDAAVEIDGSAGLETLLRSMDERDLDLAGPKLVSEDGSAVPAGPGLNDEGCPEKLMLLRREVVAAVGGVDEGYVHDHTAMVDLCLKARQRDFTCAYLANVTFTLRGPGAQPDTGDDLRRLREKWAGYADLLDRAVEGRHILHGP